jgi:hypothetical protein
MTIDYLITVTPIIMSTSAADYNPQTYLGILLWIATLICISVFDGKGKIVANYWRQGNPRPSFIKFENQKLVDLIKKDS